MEKNILRDSLIKLTKNLFFSSESDYPFEIMDWGKISTNEIEQKIKKIHDSASQIEQRSVNEFFEKCIRNTLLGGDEQSKEIASRYKKLYEYILSNTKEAMVLRCGKIEVGVYIVCITSQGNVFIIKTTAIET